MSALPNHRQATRCGFVALLPPSVHPGNESAVTAAWHKTNGVNRLLHSLAMEFIARVGRTSCRIVVVVDRRSSLS